VLFFYAIDKKQYKCKETERGYLLILFLAILFLLPAIADGYFSTCIQQKLAIRLLCLPLSEIPVRKKTQNFS